MIKLDPKCLKGEIAVALTNRGELIPCCYCDDSPTLRDKKFKKLLEVSKISKVDDIMEIFLTKEWIDFAKDLENNIGPAACINTCKVRNNPKDGIRKETFYDRGKKISENKR